MAKIIDEMGKASAVAQELKTPVTSADKLVNSDHIVYLMTEHDKPGYVFQICHKCKMFFKLSLLITVLLIFLSRHFTVVGILKMGWKKLFLYDKAGSRSEALVYCLLDFYIHESKQRKGYGKRLIEYMLQVL
jgi:alpha-tubulin N-acetyltransferase 1